VAYSGKVFEWIPISVVYSLLKDIGKSLTGRRRSNSQRLELRQKWKPQFEARLSETYRKGLRKDVIIRDLKRLDEYPESRDTKGISPWFRLGLVDVSHRGILVMLRHETLTKYKDGEHWRFTNHSAGERGDIRVVLLGSIPYDCINSVDWDGDEYYDFPHIHCMFAHKKEPYEHLGFYTATSPLPPDTLPIYHELASYEEVRRFSRKSKLWFADS